MIIVDDVYIHTDSGLWLCDVYVHIINSMDLDFSIGIFDGSLHPSLWKRERLEANLICCEFRAAVFLDKHMRMFSLQRLGFFNSV